MSLFSIEKLNTFPTQPGVYLMKDPKGRIIYVGKAKNLKSRLKQYFSSSGDSRAMIPHLISQIHHIETIVVNSEKEALLLENTLIKRHQPKYNAFLKDDKTYISLMVNNSHPWPRIQLIRYKGKPKQKGLFFGPYTSAFAARQTYDLLLHLFPLRQCSDQELKKRTRPCLLYGIKRCIAPCVNKCTHEEYDAFVQGAISFLQGKDKTLIKDLTTQMEEASEQWEFERADAILQTLRQIEHVTHSKQVVFRPQGKNCDALSLYRAAKEAIVMQLIFRDGKLIGSEHYSFAQILGDDAELLSSFLLQIYAQQPPPAEILLPLSLPNASELAEILSEKHLKKIHILSPKIGEKRKLVKLATKNAKTTFEQEKNKQELKEQLLLDLVETCQLSRYPKRIECFDTSNISGTDLVACMVAYTEGEKDSKRTRTYKIRQIQQGDDYAATHQVLTRRLLRAKEEDDLPDLILIDGGKGQLNIALSVLEELDIASVDVISIAKEKGRHDKGIRAEKLFIKEKPDAITLSPRSPLLFFIQKIRDATHEKAISFHRLRRKKRIIKTSLEEIPGIGPIKQKRLLSHFGSVKQIQSASAEELLKIPGITQKDVSNLKGA
jgi:excinuclease ABC subunit C